MTHKATRQQERRGMPVLAASTACGAEKETDFGADLRACPVCAALEGADRRYVEQVLQRRAQEQTQAQAIADTLGFCALHAVHISGGLSRSAAIARVLGGAIRFALEMLEGRKADSDGTRDCLFESAHACAACTYSARMASRILARAAGARKNERAASESEASLCYWHYRNAIYCTDATRLPILAEAQLERMESASSQPKSRGAAVEEGLALHLIAGSPRLPQAAAWENTQALRNLMDDPAGQPDRRELCPVCVAMIRDLNRRIEAARWALRMGVEGWMALPACAEHLWLFARLAGEELAQRAAEQGVVAIARLLRGGIAALERGRRRREAESKSVWYKPRSPSYILGLEREVISRAPACPVCNGLAAARERAVDRILERVRKRRDLAELEQGHGLCMKHFAHVFLFASKGATREALATVQRAKLSALHADISQLLDRRSGDGLASPGRTAQARWKDAIYRFSGWL